MQQGEANQLRVKIESEVTGQELVDKLRRLEKEGFPSMANVETMFKSAVIDSTSPAL